MLISDEKEKEEKKSPDELEEEIYNQGDLSVSPEEEELEEKEEKAEEKEKETEKEEEDEKKEEDERRIQEIVDQKVAEGVEKFKEEFKQEVGREPTKKEEEEAERLIEENWQPTEGPDAWNQVAKKILDIFDKKLEARFDDLYTKRTQVESEAIQRINSGFDAELDELKALGKDINKDVERELFEIALEETKKANKMVSLSTAYLIYEDRHKDTGEDKDKDTGTRRKDVGSSEKPGEPGEQKKEAKYSDVAGKTIDEVVEDAFE